ncbi:MAG: hypothetical protein SchgKO_20900 [Schleiferiaceae bacterium]
MTVAEVKEEYDLFFWNRVGMMAPEDSAYFMYFFHTEDSLEWVIFVSENYNTKNMVVSKYGDSVLADGTVLFIPALSLYKPLENIISLDKNYTFRLRVGERMNLSEIKIEGVYADILLIEDKSSPRETPTIHHAYILTQDSLREIPTEGMMRVPFEYFYSEDYIQDQVNSVTLLSFYSFLEMSIQEGTFEVDLPVYEVQNSTIDSLVNVAIADSKPCLEKDYSKLGVVMVLDIQGNKRLNNGVMEDLDTTVNVTYTEFTASANYENPEYGTRIKGVIKVGDYHMFLEEDNKYLSKTDETLTFNIPKSYFSEELIEKMSSSQMILTHDGGCYFSFKDGVLTPNGGPECKCQPSADSEQ